MNVNRVIELEGVKENLAKELLSGALEEFKKDFMLDYESQKEENEEIILSSYNHPDKGLTPVIVFFSLEDEEEDSWDDLFESE